MLFTLIGTFLFKYMEMDVLQVIGTLVLVAVALMVLRSIWKYFLRPGKDITRYGPWAVVTGATDGIGLAMAQAFAAKGLNLVLISRTQDKLDAEREAILAKYPDREVVTLAVDYAQFSLDSAAYVKVQQTLKDLDVGILVNNVGFSKAPPLFFAEIDNADVDGMLKINVQSCVWMTKLVLPGMTERARGAIINVGSGAASLSSPLLATYTGTKSFMQAFSNALAAEVPKGISVQCHVPLFVATKLAKIRSASLLVPSPKTYAKYALRAIGYEPVISPFWGHAIQIWIGNLLPSFVIDSFIKKKHLGLRKRGLKKLAEQKKVQ